MSIRRLILPFLLACLAASLFFNHLGDIPFHPDETSLLVESHDLEALFQSPLQLAYEPAQPQTQAQTYRALNAPLSKYVLGIGRRLAGYGPGSPAADWNWSEDWNGNIAAGALPAARLLVAARGASTVLAWVALIFVYFAAESLGGRLTGSAAALLYASNAMVLLHGRRAMAEGTLLFTTSAAMLASLYAHRRPIAAGLTSALATAAKHSGVALLALNLLSGGGLIQHRPGGWKRRLALVSVSFLIATLLLTPFLWKHPIAAVGRVIGARQQLLAEQISATEAFAPATVLTGWTNRWAGLLGGLYLGPLQFQEVGNYQQELAAMIQSYRASGWHTLGRGPVGGSALLGLTLIGIAAALRGWLQPSGEQRARLLLLGVGSALMAGVTLLLNPLPYQRYYTPLIPFVVIWEAIGFAALAGAARAAYRSFRGQRAQPTTDDPTV